MPFRYSRRLKRRGDKSRPMNERQRAHVDYFLERIEYWRGLKRDNTLARMLAARDANNAHPLRNEEEGSEVFDYLRRLERDKLAQKVTPDYLSGYRPDTRKYRPRYRTRLVSAHVAVVLPIPFSRTSSPPYLFTSPAAPVRLPALRPSSARPSL
jgi:hypothetical protein